MVTRRSAQWRSKPRRPFLARALAPFTFLMPVRTSQHAVLTPHALLPGAIAVLLACRATGWVVWTMPDAPAAASALTRRAAIASSRLGCTTPAAAAVVRRPPRVLCVCVRRLWDFDYPHGVGDGRLGDRRTAVGRGSGAAGGAVERAGGARYRASGLNVSVRTCLSACVGRA